MKTPEEMYYEWRQAFDESLDERMCKGEPIELQLLHRELGKETFLAGYKAGQEITEQEIADIIFDIRKREENERKKLPIHKQQRHDQIWEKIKVKLIGIF